MRFGTYMLIGSVFAGFVCGGYIRDRHNKCPKEVLEFDWTMLQVAAVWPGVFIEAIMLPISLPILPCKE